jgi:hypothetical protein
LGRELRPIQISQIYKEKEMNFRRWITALAVLALFAGLASAQVSVSTAGGGGTFTCQVNVAVPPQLRAEGLTELVGDIVLTCSGGVALAPGTPIPTANITVSLGSNVTSRLLSFSIAAPPAGLSATGTSEALLLIDEPGSGLAVAPNTSTTPPSAGPTGWGPGAAQVLCSTVGATGGLATIPASLVGASVSAANGGCPEYAQYVGGDFVMSSTAAGAGPYSVGANVFAGIVQGNQVAFYGIPIMPPASSGVARIFRITNVRVNASALATGAFPGTQAVTAYVSISGSTSVLLSQATQTVGFLQPGLKPSLQNTINTSGGSAMGLTQCAGTSAGSTSNGNGLILRFAGNFGTAFKTRTNAPGAANGQVVPLNQNVPGYIYNSESGFITSLISSSNGTAGLADYGTRLKAVFSNVPSNVAIYVSTTNVYNLFTSTTPFGAVPSTAAAYAQLVLTETGSDGPGGSPPVVAPTGFVANSTGTNPAVLSYAPATMLPSGQYEAIWEVINTNPSTPENFDFAVWTAYTSNPAAGSPAITGSTPATVTMSYAPTATQGAFSGGTGASNTIAIPRFTDTSSLPITLFNIAPCTTNLLFPFVTAIPGWDTGFAIMNTGQDPWGTSTQQGTCSFTLYGTNVAVVPPSPVITSGQYYANQASIVAPGFQGYMIAICNFQFAHGYAFVSDLGAQKLAHGYLALILTNGTGKRSPSGSTSNGEQLEN